ncbi:alpha/beta-hydrolase [Roridomyces roridus]|uniref:triacylglycerol lipase n=1 Tax=Roridomyces roridus TaxID=1738132 RepID=A0AAD7CI65_9AGAR|nr:alpha/beta-hydrolase [Roridomyces roridus]
MLLPTALTSFLLSLLSLLTDTTDVGLDTVPPPPQQLSFELRHLHAVSPSNAVVFADVVRDNNTHLETRRIKTYKPQSFALHAQARIQSMRFGQSLLQEFPWEEEEIVAPDVEKRGTILELAKMSSNAYIEPNTTGWYELGANWSVSYPFGWEPDADGFRGHVFANPDNSTVVLALKGTSNGFLGGGGPTAKKDKLNDNLLFSCCCARVDWTWTTGWKCDTECVEQALIEDSLFYPVATNLYNNLTYMYPDSDIWVIGHSLGGALASLLGATFGAPVVAFESPGEKMAAGRLHLPSPPSTLHITHVYHTADPIAMGTCNGVLSSCAIAGYAMESRCHLGQSIVYDTVSDSGWSVDIRTHGIVQVIDRILGAEWPPAVEAGREVPQPHEETDCVVRLPLFSRCYQTDGD